MCEGDSSGCPFCSLFLSLFFVVRCSRARDVCMIYAAGDMCALCCGRPALVHSFSPALSRSLSRSVQISTSVASLLSSLSLLSTLVFNPLSLFLSLPFCLSPAVCHLSFAKLHVLLLWTSLLSPLLSPLSLSVSLPLAPLPLSPPTALSPCVPWQSRRRPAG